MGMDPRKLSTDLIHRAGLRRVNGRLLGKLKPALEGYVWFNLTGVPPTVTHHDKEIAGNHLIDSRALKTAKEWYRARILERIDLVPLDPTFGVVARFEFRWCLPLDTRKWPALAQYGGYYHPKPDLDNLIKVPKDVLVERGWLVNDAHVVKDGGSEKRWCWPHEQPGVRIYLRSLARPDDSGATIHPAPGEKPGVLYPAPWKVAADVESVAKMERGSSQLLRCLDGCREPALSHAGGKLKLSLRRSLTGRKGAK